MANHVLVAELVAKTCLVVPCPCYPSSLASCCGHAARNIFPDRTNIVHTFTGTPCSSSQSMGINGCVRQNAGNVAPDHRESGPNRQWCFGRRGEGQRLFRVRPRAVRIQYRFRQILHCRGWDLAGKPCTLIKMCRVKAVNQREKYQPYLRWRFGDWFWWPTRWSKCEHGVRTRQWLPKPNSHQRLDSSDASFDVQPRDGARKIRPVADPSSTVPASSASAAARSIIQPGVVADVPALRRGRRVHGASRAWIREWTRP